jgi:hypothetical protein
MPQQNQTVRTRWCHDDGVTIDLSTGNSVLVLCWGSIAAAGRRLRHRFVSEESRILDALASKPTCKL